MGEWNHHGTPVWMALASGNVRPYGSCWSTMSDTAWWYMGKQTFHGAAIMLFITLNSDSHSALFKCACYCITHLRIFCYISHITWFEARISLWDNSYPCLLWSLQFWRNPCCPAPTWSPWAARLPAAWWHVWESHSSHFDKVFKKTL